MICFTLGGEGGGRVRLHVGYIVRTGSLIDAVNLLKCSHAGCQAF